MVHAVRPVGRASRLVTLSPTADWRFRPTPESQSAGWSAEAESRAAGPTQGEAERLRVVEIAQRYDLDRVYNGRKQRLAVARRKRAKRATGRIRCLPAEDRKKATGVSGRRCGARGSGARLGSLFREESEDERVCQIGELGDAREVIAAEAGGVVVGLGVVPVGPGEGHVVELLLVGLVLPDGGRTAAR